MGQTYRRVCCIDTLTTIAGGTHNINTYIIHINLNIHFLSFRHDGNCYSRCMDTAAGLCFRHSLYTMHTGFELHTGINMIAADHEYALLEAADTVLADIHHLNLPALGFGIFGIHTEKLSSKKGCLVTACAGSDLHDNVLLIHRILRDQKDLQLLLDLCDIGLCF